MLSIDERVRQYVPFFDRWFLDDPPKVLGRGNSGVVYLIHDQYDPNVSAALKVISIPQNDAQLNRMLTELGSMDAVRAWIDEEYGYALQEIQIMEHLKGDSHIVCFEDAAITSRSDTYGFDVVIRMELLVELEVFLNTCWEKYRIRRDENLYLRIWSELVSGLCLCERCGITHYDIKPDNIFYAEPSRDYFKLGDFGVSIRTEKGKKSSEGMIVGTPDYMAPEMNAGIGGDIRSDMYSLALVIYELFNKGRLPFVEAQKPTEADKRAARERRFSGAQIPPVKGMDADIWQVLNRCLQYNIADRYASMRDLQLDLEALRIDRLRSGGSGQKTPSVRDPQPAPQQPAAKKRSKAPVAIVSLMLVGGMAAAVLVPASPLHGLVFPAPTATAPITQIAQTQTEPPVPSDTEAVVAVNEPSPEPVTETDPPVLVTDPPVVERSGSAQFDRRDGGVVSGRADIRYQGQAGEREQITLLVNGAEIQTFSADAYGGWSVTLDKSVLRDGAVNTVALRAGEEVFFEDGFEYRQLIVTSGDVIDSTSRIEGETEPGSTIELRDSAGTVIAKSSTGTGNIVLQMGSDHVSGAPEVTAGETYTLVATNAAGHPSSQTLLGQDVYVDPAAYAPLTVEFEALTPEPDGRYTINAAAGAEQTMIILGQPGKRVSVVGLVNDVLDQNDTVTIERDGVLRMTRAFAEGTTQLRFSYVDNSDITCDIYAEVDTVPPQIVLDREPEEGESGEIDVTTEPGASLTLSRLGQTLAQARADESGRARIGAAFERGSYTLTAVDAFENMNERAFYVGSEKMDPVTEGDTTVTVRTRSTATVKLMSKDADTDEYVVISEGQADEDGLCVITLEQPLTGGQTYAASISYGDDGQPVMTSDISAAYVERQPIGLTVESQTGSGSLLGGDALTVGLTAEAGQDVELTLTDGVRTVSLERQTGQGEASFFGVSASDWGDIWYEPVRLTLSAAYADGMARDAASAVAFQWDSAVMFDESALTLSEDDAVLRITAEEGAAVTARGANGDLSVSEENGVYVCQVAEGEPLRAGQTVEIAAVDGAGNRKTAQITVAPTIRRQIEADLTSGMETAGGILKGGEVTVQGHAEPGKTVVASLFSGDGVEIVSQTGEPDGDGAFTISFAATVNVPPAEGAAYSAVVTYADGVGAFDAEGRDGRGIARTAARVWDCRTYVSVGEDLTPDSKSVTVTAELGATVTVTAPDGQTVQTEYKDGVYIVNLTAYAPLQVGDAYAFTAMDVYGNIETVTATVLEARRSDIVLDEIADTEDATVTVSGAAEASTADRPIAVSVTLVPSADESRARSTVVNVDEDGRFVGKFSARDVVVSAGEDVEARVDYAGVGEGRYTVMDSFHWDGYCEIALSGPYTEDSSVVTGQTDPGAYVVVFRDGELAAETWADGNGAFSWMPADPAQVFTNGSQIAARADDGRGHDAGSEPQTVQPSARRQIVVSVAGVNGDRATDESLNLTVEGEPGEDILVDWNDKPVGGTQTVGSDGSAQFAVSSSELGFPPEGESGQFIVRYADGRGVSRVGASDSFVWDTYCGLKADALFEDSASLNVETEPGAAVTLTFGRDVVSGSADEQGRLTLDLASLNGKLAVGGAYTVTARDAAGNEASMSDMVQEANREPIVLDVLSDTDGESVTVSGTAQPGSPDRPITVSVTLISASDAERAQTKTLDVDENGRFAGEFSARDVVAAAGDDVTVKADYAGVGEGRYTATGSFHWDGYCQITLEGDYTEDSDALTGQADPGAAVVISKDGSYVGDTMADEDGAFTWTPENPAAFFSEGAQIVAQAADPSGHIAATQAVEVGASPRAALSVAVDGIAGGYATRQVLTVELAGEPGMGVVLSWRGTPLGGEHVLGSDGHAKVEIDASALSMPAEGQKGRLDANYADGKGVSRAGQSETFTWDTYCGVESVDDLYEGSDSLNVVTEPGATVLLEGEHDGVAYSATSDADRGGRCTLYLSELSEYFVNGESYTLTVTDTAGNTAVFERTVQETHREKIQFIGPEGLVSGGQVNLRVTAAEPNMSVGVEYGGEVMPATVLSTDGAGKASIVLNAGDFGVGNTETDITLRVVYADELAASSAGDAVNFTWDAGVSLTLEGMEGDIRQPGRISEDSDALVVTTDPGATVYLSGTYSGTTTDYPVKVADGEGIVVFPKWEDAAFQANETYTVTAVDAAGNASQAVIAVEETTRRDITWSVSSDAQGANGELTGETVTVSGDAEPDKEIIVWLFEYDRDNDRLIYIDDETYGNVAKYVTTDANGRYEVSFTAEECAVADRGGSGGIILRFDLGYSDGKADSKWRQTESYVWDCVRPDAPKADLTQLESESRSLTGTAEPNAMIYAALGDDSTLGAAFAEEDGSFTLSWNQALEVGDVVRLTAFDGAGNASPELALPVVQLVHQAGKIGVADRVYKSDEVLAVSGFFACRREDADIIRLVWSDAAGVSEREITMIPGSNDDNVRAQKALSGYPLGDDVTYVQAFTAHVPLSDCESGTYRLMLRREAWGEDIIVMDEAEVQVERVGMTAGGGEGAVSAAAATWTVLSQGGYAIGFDAPQRAQSGDDVILTGTIYTTVSDHAIRRVYVNSDIDTDEQQVYDSERDFDVAEVHSVEELLSADGACVLWLDRSLDGVPGRIVDELGGINASSTNAGFVLRIRGEDLQNGDTLMLRTQVGQMLYGGEVRLSIGGSGYAAVTEALISQLTAGWTTSADGG